MIMYRVIVSGPAVTEFKIFLLFFFLNILYIIHTFLYGRRLLSTPARTVTRTRTTPPRSCTRAYSCIRGTVDSPRSWRVLMAAETSRARGGSSQVVNGAVVRLNIKRRAPKRMSRRDFWGRLICGGREEPAIEPRLRDV